MNTAPENEIILADMDAWEAFVADRRLYGMNDGGRSFAEIADYIDANL